MKVVATLAHSDGLTYDIVADNHNIYVASHSVTGEPRIAKIDPVTMSEVSALPIRVNRATRLALSDQFLFAGATDQRVIKIDPATMTEIAAVTISSMSGIIAADERHVYAAIGTFPGKITKIDQAELNAVTTLALNVGENTPQYVKCLNGYIYALATNTSNQLVLVKVNAITMERVTALNLNGAAGNWNNSIVTDDRFLYVGIDGSPDTIAKIDPEAMTIISNIPLESGENGTDIACDGQYLFVTTVAGAIIKIDLATGERVAVLDLERQLGPLSNSFVAISGQYVYVATGSAPYQLIQIDPENEAVPTAVLASIRFGANGAVTINPDITRTLSATLGGSTVLTASSQKTATSNPAMRGAASFRATGLILNIPTGVYSIDADEVFSRNQPLRGETIVNYIEVYVNPLKPVVEAEEVYKSSEALTFAVGEVKTITVYFDKEPVTEAAAALAEVPEVEGEPKTGLDGLVITKETWYCWGGMIEIVNNAVNARSCLIVVNGKPLEVQGREVITRKDEISILENGVKKYTFDNPFVQDRATAERIADKLLSYANAKRDISIDWRGNPALELADVVMIPEYQRQGLDQRGIFYVTKQELEFDGGLTAKLEGRKMDNG